MEIQQLNRFDVPRTWCIKFSYFDVYFHRAIGIYYWHSCSIVSCLVAVLQGNIILTSSNNYFCFSFYLVLFSNMSGTRCNGASSSFNVICISLQSRGCLHTFMLVIFLLSGCLHDNLFHSRDIVILFPFFFFLLNMKFHLNLSLF